MALFRFDRASSCVEWQWGLLETISAARHTILPDESLQFSLVVQRMAMLSVVIGQGKSTSLGDLFRVG